MVLQIYKEIGNKTLLNKFFLLIFIAQLLESYYLDLSGQPICRAEKSNTWIECPFAERERQYLFVGSPFAGQKGAKQ